MLCCAVLCCAVLCCAVLCCARLCCAVLCCAVLCCAVLGCAVLCCAVGSDCAQIASPASKVLNGACGVQHGNSSPLPLARAQQTSTCLLWVEFAALVNHCHGTVVCICAGQQSMGSTPDPSPTLSPPSPLNGSTLPTAPLSSLPINFGSSPIANRTAIPLQAVAAPAPAAAVTAATG